MRLTTPKKALACVAAVTVCGVASALVAVQTAPSHKAWNGTGLELYRP